MPELPEVQSVVDSLRSLVVGKRFGRIELGPHDVITPAGFDLVAALRGRTVAHLARRAKRIVFTLDDGHRFFIHLGMTGQLTIEPAASQRKKHTHLVATLDDHRVGATLASPERPTGTRRRQASAGDASVAPTREELRFVDPRRFGEIRWLGNSPDETTLGPEPLTMRTATFARQLASTRRVIKIALLDQRIVAGIGNIYADESLHAAGLSPLTRARDLDAEQIARLTRSIKTILRRAIRAGGSTLRDYVNGRGEAGGFQHRHRVYDREGKPCPSCKRPIERIVLGGRSTHFCPNCQVA